jgi:hypothetical protein
MATGGSVMFEWTWDALDPFLIRMAILLGVAMLVRAKLTPVLLLGAGLLAWLGGDYDPLYQVFMTFWPERNPQLSTLLYLVVLVPLSSGQLLIRRRRSVDRVIISLMLGAIATTTLLFHTSLVTGLMPQWQTIINYESRTMLMLEDTSLAHACQGREHQCLINRPIQSLETSQRIRDGLTRIEQSTQAQRQKRFVVHSYAELNDIRSKDIAFITYFADEYRQRVILAQKDAEYVHYTVKQMFYFLATVAHTFWIVLALFLVYWHGRMIRRSRANTSQSRRV